MKRRPRARLLKGKVAGRFSVGHDLAVSYSERTEEAEAFYRELAPREENQTAARLRFNTYEHTVRYSLRQTDGVSPAPRVCIGTVLSSRVLVRPTGLQHFGCHVTATSVDTSFTQNGHQ